MGKEKLKNYYPKTVISQTKKKFLSYIDFCLYLVTYDSFQFYESQNLSKVFTVFKDVVYILHRLCIYG